jgi:hypothetical protein
MVGAKDKLLKHLRVAMPAFLLFYFFMSLSEIVDLYRKRELLVLYTNGRKLFTDFNAFYNAGLLCRNYFENHVPFYEFNVQMNSLAKVIAPYKPEVPMLSVNPPHYFLLCEPLSYVSPYHGWIIWTIISLVCLLASIFLFDIKHLLSKYEQICCIIGCLATSTTYSALRHGQNSFMLLFAVTLFWRLLETRKYFLSGLSLILCMFKPQYLPALLSAGLLVGRLRFVAGAALSFVVIYIVSVSAFGAGIFQSWWDFVSIKQSHPDFAYMMQNIRGEITICTSGRDDAVGTFGSVLILGFALLFILWLWYSFRKRFKELFIFRILAAITISVMLFSSPHTQSNDYVLFYLSCVWVWQFMKVSTSSRLKSFLKLTIASYPYLSWIFLLVNLLFLIMRIQPYLAVNITVYLLALALLLREPRSSSIAVTAAN